ncbi:MAG: mechanosensitive ion channel family protein [Actinomycetota bacterium]|nr:mechanosensitive ion channel family protein [Actinomycetota bacterium]
MHDGSVIAVLSGAAALGLSAHALAVVATRRSLRGGRSVLQRSILEHTKAPLRLIVPLLAVSAAVAVMRLPASLSDLLAHVLVIAMTVASAWLAVRFTYVVEDVMLERFAAEGDESTRARQLKTQVLVFRRVMVVFLILVAAAVVMLTFRPVRAAGAGLLASAGVVGIVAGVAARPIATNVLAGIQIAISQPIRVEDVVVVQGEWGRIEQINLTYVVVRIWDLRRLVLPISWFIQNTFENWTRDSSALLGYVYLEVDYTAPVEAIRKRLGEILDASPTWDRQTWNLQVTHSAASTLQLRALMSAPDSASRWNLECEVREKLVCWLQQDHPGALPKVRNAVSGSLSGTLGDTGPVQPLAPRNAGRVTGSDDDGSARGRSGV